MKRTRAHALSVLVSTAGFSACSSVPTSFEPGVPGNECLLLRDNPNGVLGMDVGASIPLGGGQSMFVFGDTFYGSWSSGGSRRVSGAIHSSAAIVDDASKDKCFAGSRFVSTAAKSPPLQLLEPKGAEPGDMVWPLGPGLSDGTNLELLYTWVRPDSSNDFGFKTMGNGIVTAPVGSTTIAVDVHALSAPATEAMPSAWLSRDGSTYLYRCGKEVGKGWDPCIVGRASIADSASLGAYKYFVAGEGYVGAYGDATIVVEGTPAFTVTWNAFLGAYLEIYVEPFSHEVSARTASRPEGPFSDKVHLATCSLPSDDPKSYCYAAFEHAELDATDAHAITVTYDTNSTDFGAMIAHPNVYWPRLLTIDLTSAGVPTPPP